MGSNISKAHNPMPITLKDWLIDGKMDVARYLVYKRRINKRGEDEKSVMLFIEKKRKSNFPNNKPKR